MDRSYSIPDEVLELILLRLDSPISLIRAASTSKRWRRIVAAVGFLPRFASVNKAHHVAGSYYNGSQIFPQVFVPAPPSALLDRSHFCLDFLQSDNDDDSVCPFDPLSWKIKDSRGSLLLLAYHEYDLHIHYLHMIVCEPFTRRRRRITFPLVNGSSIHTGPFFLDAAANAGAGFSNYGLVCALNEGWHSYRVAMFSSSASERGSWKEISVHWKSMYFLGKTKKSLYWRVADRVVAAMDRRTAEFSTSKLPADLEDWGRQRLRVAACLDDESRIIVNKDSECGVLKFFARSQDGSEWALEKKIQLWDVLPGCERSYFSGPLGPVWLTTVDTTIIVVEFQSWTYRLDIETMEAEQASKDAYRDVAFPCELPWPPAFHACTDLL